MRFKSLCITWTFSHRSRPRCELGEAMDRREREARGKRDERGVLGAAVGLSNRELGVGGDRE